MRSIISNLIRNIVLSTVVLFAVCCSGGDTAIVPPIKETASAGPDSLWMITDRGNLVRLSGGGNERTEMPFPVEPEVIFFLNERDGWAYGDDRQVWSTSDAGATWAAKGTHPEFTPGASDLVFTDNQHGWLMLWFGIYTTEDGGATWSRAFPTDEFKSVGAQPTCVSALGRDVAWVGMSNSVVLLTTDRGRSWKVIRIPRSDGADAPPGTVHSTPDIKSIHAASAREAWAGPGGGSVEGLYYTNDGGDSWSQLLTDPVRTNFGQTSISFPAPDNGWLVGIEFVRDPDSPGSIKGVAFKTEDGKSWKRLKGETFDTAFNKVAFSDPQRGWLVGTDYQQNRSYIHRTDDGGKSWRLVHEEIRPARR